MGGKVKAMTGKFWRGERGLQLWDKAFRIPRNFQRGVVECSILACTVYMQIMRQVKLYCDLLYHHRKRKWKWWQVSLPVHADHEGTKQSLVAESTLATLNESLEDVLINNIRNRVRSILKYILEKIQFLDTKANQPCEYLSQRLSQTAAFCSCSCSSDESSWLHFPQPLYSPLISDYSHDNISYLNFLPTLS